MQWARALSGTLWYKTKDSVAADAEEEHDAAQYGIIPEPPEVNDLSFNTANDDDLTPDEKKEAEATKQRREAEEKKGDNRYREVSD